LVAGTDISVSGATGAVTVNDTSTLATVTGRGASTSTAVTFSGGATFSGGSLGGTAGNQVQMAQFTSTDSNSNQLLITETRTATGTSWTSAGTRIQEKIDATWMGYIQFNGAVGGGISFGTGTSSTSATSITDKLYIDTSGNFYPANNGSQNLGSGSNYFATVYGKATTAQYADLAENYLADQAYPAGTVLVFGGLNEVTTTVTGHDSAVAGIVSSNPAHLMNSLLTGPTVVAVGLTGRLPCQVQGPVKKGTVLVTSTTAGVAQAIDNSKFVPGCVVGKALEEITDDSVQTIEVVVGRF
jgi:hypothetical protein